MPYCSECKKLCLSYQEDLSFDYPGTHCNHGQGGTHHVLGDEKSDCCDADVTEYPEGDDDAEA